MPKKKNSLPSPTQVTIGHLLRSLTVTQAWSVGAVLLSLSAGVFTAGAVLQPVVQKWADLPKTCADKIGYPLGIWYTRGASVQVGAQDTSFSAELGDFTSLTKGVWYAGVGKPKPDRTYPNLDRKEFSSSAAPAPGRRIAVTWINLEDNNFVGEGNFLVSDDGCSMEGPFKGTGSSLPGGVVEVFIQYCWSQADECPPVNPDWQAYILGRTNR